jgi:hypothetical protein
VSRAQWFDRLAPSLSASQRAALDPFDDLLWERTREQLRAIERYAAIDAQRGPLRTPCLDRWRATRPVQFSGPVYEAACWEACALDLKGMAARERCFTYARAIIAVARGELVQWRPGFQAAA